MAREEEEEKKEGKYRMKDLVPGLSEMGK